MMKSIYVLSLLFFLCACRPAHKAAEVFKDVDASAVGQDAVDMTSVSGEQPDCITVELAAETDVLRWSEVADSVTYVLLETPEEALIGRVDKLLFCDSLIYVLDRTKSRGVYAFTLEGRYRGKIGDVGQGPGEFAEPTDVSVYGDRVYVYDQFSHRLSSFTRSGKFLSARRVPFFAVGMHAFSDSLFAWHTLDADNYHLENLVGYSVLLTDSAFRVKKRGFYRTPGRYSSFWITENFQGGNPGVTFHLPFSGDIFSVDGAGNVTKRFVLDFREKTLPASYLLEENWARFVDEDTQRKYLLFPGEFYETSSMSSVFYFTYLKDHVQHYGLYDKSHGRLRLAAALLNDLFPALPVSSVKAAWGNLLVSVASPGMLLAAAGEISRGELEEQVGAEGVAFLSSLGEEDNPILVISHLKVQ